MRKRSVSHESKHKQKLVALGRYFERLTKRHPFPNVPKFNQAQETHNKTGIQWDMSWLYPKTVKSDHHRNKREWLAFGSRLNQVKFLDNHSPGWNSSRLDRSMTDRHCSLILTFTRWWFLENSKLLFLEWHFKHHTWWFQQACFGVAWFPCIYSARFTAKDGEHCMGVVMSAVLGSCSKTAHQPIKYDIPMREVMTILSLGIHGCSRGRTGVDKLSCFWAPSKRIALKCSSNKVQKKLYVLDVPPRRLTAESLIMQLCRIGRQKDIIFSPSSLTFQAYLDTKDSNCGFAKKSANLATPPDHSLTWCTLSAQRHYLVV